MAKTEMLQALNLQMPSKVPRTEYSATGHWQLIESVTGLHVDEKSPEAQKHEAVRQFMRAWDYGMMWNTDIYKDVFGDKRTDMGHAVFAAGGTDYSEHITCLFNDPEDVYGYDMFVEYGTPEISDIVRRFEAKMEWQKSVYPDSCLLMNGIYITCISGILELTGWDTFLMAAGLDSGAFGRFINRYCQWIRYYFEALALCKSPVVMVHDDFVWNSGGFLSPAFYREFVFPNYKKLLEPLREAGKRILFTADGNYTEYIDDIAACGINGFVLEPVTDMQAIADRYGKMHAFIGNADTKVLLTGTKQDIYDEVKRCMDIGKGCPGFVMAVGNHIPANTPVENALWYNECYEKLARR